MNKAEALKILDKYKKNILHESTISEFFVYPHIPDKKLNNAMKKYAKNIQKDEVIGLLDTTYWGGGGEGALLTPYKIVSKVTFFGTQTIWFDEVSYIEYEDNPEYKFGEKIKFHMKNGDKKEFNEISFNMKILKKVIESFIEANTKRTESITNSEDLEYNDEKIVNMDYLVGYSSSIADNMNRLSNQERILGDTGHGVAAERANDLLDRITLNNAKLVGDDNAKNGADRLVNGQAIQSKYFQDGRLAIKACFDEIGTFRYIQENGKPMIIEVPRDQAIYDAAIKEMKTKIINGQVPGVKNPQKAYDLVQKGWFTYQQAVNIAKAGTIESVVYDSASGAVSSIFAGGMSSLFMFANSIWKGEDMDKALEKAFSSGLSIGGVSFLTSVLGSQLQKSVFYKDAILNGEIVNLKAMSEALVEFVGPKGASSFANAFKASGKNALTGAAAKSSAEKLIRGNIITSLIMVGVLSIKDIGNMFDGKISGAQLIKNITNTTAGVFGGAGGATIGATIGSAIIPGIGTVLGGIIGGVIGGSKAANVSNTVTSVFIEDDANEMIKIIQTEFKVLADEYLLGQRDGEKIVDRLQSVLTGEKLKIMYSEKDKHLYAKNLLEPIVREVVSLRPFIYLPSIDDLKEGFKDAVYLLENGKA